MLAMDGFSSDEEIVEMEGCRLSSVGFAMASAGATVLVDHAVVLGVDGASAAPAAGGGAGNGFVVDDDFEVVSFGAAVVGGAPAPIDISSDDEEVGATGDGVVRLGGRNTGLDGGGSDGLRWYADGDAEEEQLVSAEEQLVPAPAVLRKPAAKRKRAARPLLALPTGQSAAEAAIRDAISVESADLPRCRRRVESAPAGSKRRAELEADLLSAKVAFHWLRRSHPAWFGVLADGARIREDAALFDAMAFSFMLLGSRYVDCARRAVIRYEAWCGRRRDSLVSGGYPPSPHVVAWFLQEESEASEAALKAKAERDEVAYVFKGTVASSLVKHLSYAESAFTAPFGPELLRCTAVQVSAAPPPSCEFAVEEEAHMSVYLACLFEELARDGSCVDGVVVCEVARDWARFFAFLCVNGLRTVEGLRSQFRPLQSPTAEAAEYVCAGGKPKRMVKLRPFRDVAPAEGFTGPWPWFRAWVAERVGWPFIARRFVVRRDATFGTEAVWPEELECASASDVRRAWYGLAELAPHSVSMATMQLRRSTPYATRHVVQDVVRDQLWPIEERNELNRWAALPRRVDADGSAAGSGKRVQSARRRAVTRYSAGDAALTKRLELRLEAVRIVSAFIAASGEQWCDALPHQVGDQSSFSFLRDVSDRTAAGSE